MLGNGSDPDKLEQPATALPAAAGPPVADAAAATPTKSPAAAAASELLEKQRQQRQQQPESTQPGAPAQQPQPQAGTAPAPAASPATSTVSAPPQAPLQPPSPQAAAAPMSAPAATPAAAADPAAASPQAVPRFDQGPVHRLRAAHLDLGTAAVHMAQMSELMSEVYGTFTTLREHAANGPAELKLPVTSTGEDGKDWSSILDLICEVMEDVGGELSELESQLTLAQAQVVAATSEVERSILALPAAGAAATPASSAAAAAPFASNGAEGGAAASDSVSSSAAAAAAAAPDRADSPSGSPALTALLQEVAELRGALAAADAQRDMQRAALSQLRAQMQAAVMQGAAVKPDAEALLRRTQRSFELLDGCRELVGDVLGSQQYMALPVSARAALSQRVSALLMEAIGLEYQSRTQQMEGL